MNRGTADFNRTHTFTVSTVAEIPVGRGKTFLSDVSRAVDFDRRRLAVQPEHA